MQRKPITAGLKNENRRSREIIGIIFNEDALVYAVNDIGTNYTTTTGLVARMARHDGLAFLR